MSDIQSLCCLLSDIAAMSFQYTRELPRGDSFWAGIPFVCSSVYYHCEVKSSLAVVQITGKEENLHVEEERVILAQYFLKLSLESTHKNGFLGK